MSFFPLLPVAAALVATAAYTDRAGSGIDATTRDSAHSPLETSAPDTRRATDVQQPVSTSLRGHSSHDFDLLQGAAPREPTSQR